MKHKNKKTKRGLCGTDSFYMNHPYITFMLVNLAVFTTSSVICMAISGKKDASII